MLQPLNASSRASPKASNLFPHPYQHSSQRPPWRPCIVSLDEERGDSEDVCRNTEGDLAEMRRAGGGRKEYVIPISPGEVGRCFEARVANACNVRRGRMMMSCWIGILYAVLVCVSLQHARAKLVVCR